MTKDDLLSYEIAPYTVTPEHPGNPEPPFTATIAASIIAQLSLYVVEDDLLLGMITQLHAIQECDHVRSYLVVYKVLVRASDSRPEGLGSMLDLTKYPPSAHGSREEKARHGGGFKWITLEKHMVSIAALKKMLAS
ncbi:hypothetical protein TNCV_2873771 [Trichonephila clavipes]|nr:hypothetical protein TNCV_2873771 [Trichonephila clavipes]